jgi:hypothetical protein
MLSQFTASHRRISVVLAVIAALATGAGFASEAVTASARTVATTQAASENWAGYVGSGRSFTSVSGSWTEPAVKSDSSATGAYSAFWVGLGGSGSASQSLEQVGTASDWARGHAEYYAWYELAPSAMVKLPIAIHAGDHISASVAVHGTTVTIWLSDRSSGQSVTKTLSMSSPDTSSAEWIAEAPSAQSATGTDQVLSLADFGKVTFTSASATANGHTGTISDSSWTAERVTLASGGNGATGLPPDATGFGVQSATNTTAAARTSSLSSDGSSFSVTWTSSQTGGGTPAQPGAGTGPGYGPGPGYAPGAGDGYSSGLGLGYAY